MISNLFTMLYDLFSNLVEFLLALNTLLWSVYVIIPILIGVGLYFTVKFNFVQITMMREMFRSVFSNVHKDKNSISTFEAFIVGLASRIGTGNLAGVALAVAIGGPGAIFWMWVVAILGAASAFVESTLAQLYKIKDPETKYRGGPAYYMRDGLGSKSMGSVFAVLISVAFGLAFNSVQSNTITSSLGNSLGIPADNQTLFSVIIGGILVVATGAVIFLGAQAIAKVSTYLVPFMAIMYLILAFVIVVLQFDRIPEVFSMIFDGAFNASAAFGGVAGAMINGIKRGLFSNEAGMGSAPNAAATADADHPITQGLIQSLGVFIDTIVICSTTGFIILVSGIELQGATDGIILTGNAMSSILGDWSLHFLSIAVFCFAFSSILGNYFYSQSNIEYLSENKIALNAFKVVVLAMVFIGAVVPTQLVWTFADLAMALMALLNLFAIVKLSNYVTLLLKDYKQLKKSGKPLIFDSSKYEMTKEFDIWDKSK